MTVDVSAISVSSALSSLESGNVVGIGSLDADADASGNASFGEKDHTCHLSVRLYIKTNVSVRTSMTVLLFRLAMMTAFSSSKATLQTASAG